MGVKHGRDYEGILTDLTQAIGRIPDRYVFRNGCRGLVPFG